MKSSKIFPETLITNSSKKAGFLGFDINVDRRTNTIRNKNGVIGRYFCKRVKLIMQGTNGKRN